MSKAFTKEIDDTPVPPILERPVSAATNLVTPRGAKLIEANMARIDAESASARNQDELAVLQRDRRYWDKRRATMQIITPLPNPDTAGFGTSVTLLRNGKTVAVTVVGEDEAEPAKGLIAWTAPLARAIEGAAPGEVVEFSAAGRAESLEILSVAPAP